MPVLPATFTFGSAAAVPVPYSTTSTISSSSVRATRRFVTRTERPLPPGRSEGTVRSPPAATVCATDAITSGVASTLPCPIALAPTSSGLVISFA